MQANEQEISWTKRNKCLFTARGKKVLKPKRELTKNGRTITARLTESEYDEWVKLGKISWLRSLLKDKKFERADVQKPKVT